MHTKDRGSVSLIFIQSFDFGNSLGPVISVSSWVLRHTCMQLSSVCSDVRTAPEASLGLRRWRFTVLS